MKEQVLLGKVFISYSSKDRSFTRRLEAALRERGYETWMDEHELHGGDHLAKELSEAISQAKVLIVVVSRHSATSKWLRYELGLATTSMVSGKSRVIPLLLRGATPLPEVAGLVYISFRHTFESGLARLLKTLEHEAQQVASRSPFWAQVELILKKVFDGSGFSSIIGEYKSKDWNFVSLPHPTKQGESIDIAYDTVSDYGNEPKPLSDGWWQEFSDAVSDAPFSRFLLVTERPIPPELGERHPACDRIVVRHVHTSYVETPTVRVVLVDLSGVHDQNRRLEILKVARQILQESGPEDEPHPLRKFLEQG